MVHGRQPDGPQGAANLPAVTGGIPGRTTPVSLHLPRGLPATEWSRVLTLLGLIGRGSQWWIGDAIVYGEDTFGEDYAQYVEDAGYKPNTLVNLAWVARSVAPERRVEGLSWSHHEAVAGLDADEQERWLDRAAVGDDREAWTVSRLREEIRATRPGGLTRVEQNVRRWWALTEALAGERWLDLKSALERDLVKEEHETTPVDIVARWATARLISRLDETEAEAVTT